MAVITVSEAMRGAAREIAVRGNVTLPGGMVRALDGRDIRSLVISEGGEQGILPGDVLSASCQLVLDNADGRWSEGGSVRGNAPLRGARFAFEFGVKVGSAHHYEPLGVYFCNDASWDENGATIALECYDSIYFQTAWLFEDALTYPQYLRQVWGEAVRRGGYVYTGETPNGGIIIDAPPAWGEITVREAMGFVAAAMGCFVRVNRLGELELVPLLPATAVEIAPYAYLARRHLNAEYGPINKLRVLTVNRKGDADSEPYEIALTSDNASEVREFVVTGNPLFLTGGAHVSALAQGMLTSVAGVRYAECRFTWRGDPAVAPGTLVRLTDKNGDMREYVLSRQTLKLDGGFSAECVSGVPSARGMTTRVLTPPGGVDAGKLVGVVHGGNIAANAISASKLAAGSVTAEKISAEAITTEKIAAGAVDAGRIAAGAVTAGKLAVGAVEAESIAAGAVTAEKCVAGMITAESGLIGTGAIGTAQIADGSITAAKVVSLNADVITAGTLSAERLLIVGADSVVYEINASASGLTAQELTDEAYQTRLSGSVIVAESITSAQIAAEAIVANKIAAGAITADKVDIASLFAAAATIAAIRTMTVKSVEDGSTLVINKDQVMFETPKLSIVATGAEEGQEVMRADMNGGHFKALSVTDRIDCDMVAWRYDGPAVYENVTSFVGILDAVNYCYMDYDVFISLAPGLGTIGEEIEFIGIHGPGRITVNGNQTAASAGVRITSCASSITFRELYADYTEVRSPHCRYIDCSASSTYTKSGSAAVNASPTRTKLSGSSWLSEPNYVWQGYTSGSGRHQAVFWFPGLFEHKDAAILSATVRLKRVSGIGKGDRVDVVAYTATNAGPSGNFTGLVSRGFLGEINNGEVKTFSISPEAAQVLCAGGCLVLDPGDTSFLSGKSYSSNYCKYYGYGMEYPPLLTITYRKEDEIHTAVSTMKSDMPETVFSALTGGATETGTANGRLRAARQGRIGYLGGGVTAQYPGAAVTIAAVPEDMRPAYGNAYALCPCSGGRIARVFVSPAGEIKLEWIRDISTGALYTSAAIWIDLNFCYLID